MECVVSRRCASCARNVRLEPSVTHSDLKLPRQLVAAQRAVASYISNKGLQLTKQEGRRQCAGTVHTIRSKLRVKHVKEEVGRLRVVSPHCCSRWR